MAATNGYFHIDLSIMYSINRLVVWPVKCQIYKMTSSNVFICPQLRDIQFTVIKEERHQNIFTFKKLTFDR